MLDFFSLIVQDRDGNERTLHDVVGKHTPTLLIMLRHFGWYDGKTRVIGVV